MSQYDEEQVLFFIVLSEQRFVSFLYWSLYFTHFDFYVLLFVCALYLMGWLEYRNLLVSSHTLFCFSCPFFPAVSSYLIAQHTDYPASYILCFNRMWGGKLHEGGHDWRLGHLRESLGLFLREMHQKRIPVSSYPLFRSHGKPIFFQSWCEIASTECMWIKIKTEATN